MKTSVEVRCIVCQLVFCCAECRWKHEQNAHSLTYECPLCRGSSYLCRPQQLNQDFIDHLTTEHLPLRCKKCKKTFEKMEDFIEIEKCTSISELIEAEVEIKKELNVEERFDSIYEKINNENDNFEAIVSVNKSSKTAVITPIIRKKHLVDYDSSDDDMDESPKVSIVTPHPKLVPKTPRLKKQRAATPHAKKLLGLVRQKVIDEYDESADGIGYEGLAIDKTPTPSRNDNLEIPDIDQEMTTPTSHLPHVMKLAQIVTTSTPTHPSAAGWSLFPGPGNDSPLSEIETGESPAQSMDKEPLKSDEVLPKLKGIISSRLSSQESTEKQVTFQESNTESSVKIKKVKFADDTIFNREPPIQRVYRKPKRMLTPGPQKPKYRSNPRFQALINRFENRVATITQTPLNIKPEKGLDTPSVEHNVLARAISFKESPGLENTKESNELFNTCVDNAEPVNNAITTLTTNIAGSLQTCLASLLRTNDEETEIQFKFVITKKKVSVKRMADGGDEDLSEIDRDVGSEKENIWSTVTKAVKKVFWGEKETPHRSYSSDSSLSSASKRKYEHISEDSPLNHKRHKYEGRIRGRPPLQRTKNWGLAGLKPTQSAEQQSLLHHMNNQDVMNQSF